MNKVAIILGSESDRAVADKAVKVLDERKIPYEVRVISAHRNPEELDRYLKESEDSVAVIVAIAGLSAALPGVIASKTEKPVIGVPVSGKLFGMDALLSMVQMPSGVPVGVVGIDNGENAALLALRIVKLKRH
ncbi:MAG: 5-(carboxyamino)imidazole ribonucleotide mutase [Methanophagales archaeon]|nr:5-(carboxyamino)imidazole ribonucleotide mutase [Methanophagales archaeon]